MNYENEMTICAENLVRWMIEACGPWPGGEYELTWGDYEYLRGEQPDSLECLPFVEESIQTAFEKDVQEEVNRLLSE